MWYTQDGRWAGTSSSSYFQSYFQAEGGHKQDNLEKLCTSWLINLSYNRDFFFSYRPNTVIINVC